MTKRNLSVRIIKPASKSPKAMYGLVLLACSAVSGSSLAAGEVHENENQSSLAQPLSKWRVGFAVASVDAAYRGQKSEKFFVPVVGYEGEKVYFRGAELGYRLYRKYGGELAAVVNIAPFRFEPKKNRITELQQLDERDFRIETGLKLNQYTRYGRLTAQTMVNVRDFDTGYRASLGYHYSLSPQPQFWQLGPRVDISYLSGSFTNYFYGISAAEAQRSGLSEYKGKAGWNTTVSVEGYYRLNERWTFAGSVGRTFIDNEIRNSPMTKGSHTTSAFLYLSYQL